MSLLSRLSALTAGRRSRWAVIGAWVALAVVLAPLQGPLQEEAADESETFLVRGSESLEAKRLVDEKFRRGSEMAAVIAYFRDGGISSEDRDAHQRRRSRDLPGEHDPEPDDRGLRVRAVVRHHRPAGHEPGPGSAHVAGLEHRPGLGADDRRQHADGRGGGDDDPLDRSAADRRRHRPAGVRHRRGGFRGRSQRGREGHRRDAAARHLRGTGAAAARDLSLAARRVGTDPRGRRRVRGGRRSHLRCWSPPG